MKTIKEGGFLRLIILELFINKSELAKKSL